MVARWIPALVALAALTSACALKAPPDPADLRRQALPNVQPPEQWATQGAEGAPVTAGWLGSFGDRMLFALVGEALAYNGDLRAAGARVEAAGGYATLAGATLYPAVNLLARGGGQLSGDNSGLQGAALVAGWELDVWGRVRYGRAAAEAQYASAAADLEYARQSLVALVVKSWVLAVEARLQRAVAEDAVRAAERLVSLARDRERVGRGDAVDVANAEANLATYRDTVRQLELAYGQALRALELLLGRYPAADVAVPNTLPALTEAVPAGLPSELLERRPDIIAAERRVAAAFNRTGEAQAARLPRISLTASVNSISSDLFVLQDRDNPVWSVGASLLAPIYQGGALRAQVEIRNAEQRQAVAEYAARALRAFGDVENALAAEFAAREREQILTGAVGQWQRAADLSRVAFEVGSIDLRPVQQQQLGLYAARSALLRVQSEQRVQRVNLHLALGGGFGDADAMLHDRVVTNRAPDGTVVDVYRVVGNGETTLDAPPEGWPASVRIRLHGFIALERLAVQSGTAVMQCSASSSLIRGKGHECTSGGAVTGRSVARDDYIEFTVPDSLLGADTTRVEVRWAEATATARR